MLNMQEFKTKATYRHIAVIPARYAASRFPGKLLQTLGDKTVIAQTYGAAKATGLFEAVIVATDSEEIKTVIEAEGGTVIMTRADHPSGTDRIAEAVQHIEADLIVNVQGDTPFINKAALEKLVGLFSDESVQVASLMDVISSNEDLQNPNVVKVCVDHRMNSLFFSRSVLPYVQDPAAVITHYRHIGVYAFRKKMLLQFVQWPVGPLEAAEKLEGLRYLENGVQLRMAVVPPIGVDINTPDDLKRAQEIIHK